MALSVTDGVAIQLKNIFKTIELMPFVTYNTSNGDVAQVNQLKFHWTL